MLFALPGKIWAVVTPGKRACQQLFLAYAEEPYRQIWIANRLHRVC